MAEERAAKLLSKFFACLFVFRHLPATLTCISAVLSRPLPEVYFPIGYSHQNECSLWTEVRVLGMMSLYTHES
jgi:hypothetical protein